MFPLIIRSLLLGLILKPTKTLLRGPSMKRSQKLKLMVLVISFIFLESTEILKKIIYDELKLLNGEESRLFIGGFS